MKYAFVRNIDIFFVLIAAAFCNFFNVPEIVKAFLAIPAFIIIPYRFGNPFFITSERYISNISFDPVSKGLLSWSIGVIGLLLSAIALNFLGIFSAQLYVLLILVVIVSVLIFNILSSFQKENSANLIRKKLNDVFGDYRVVILVLIISLLPVIYFMSSTEFPLAIGIDSFSFILNTNQIIEDNYLELFSTWGSTYPPTLPIFLAIKSILFNVSPLSLCWALPFLFYPLFSLGIYIFSYAFSKRWEISFIAAIFAVASTGFSKWVFINSLYYIAPKNVIYLIFPFLLFLVQKNLISGGQTSHNKHSQNNPHKASLTSRMGESKILSSLFGVVVSALIFSVFSLSFSLAPHHFPHIYVILAAILLFLLFTILASKSLVRKQLEIKSLILVSISLSVFFFISMFILLPLSEQEIPHLKIFLGIAATILMVPFFTIGKIRERIAPRYFLLFCVITLISFSFHFIMGLAVVFIIYFYNVSSLLAEKASLKAIVILGSIIGFSFIMIILQQYYVVSLNQISDVIPSMFETGREFNLAQKNEMLINTYSGIVVVLSILGIIVLSLREKIKALPVACLYSMILFIYFLPTPGIYRFLTYLTPLLSFLAASAFFLHNIKLPIFSKTRSASVHNSGVKKRTPGGLYVLIIMLSLVIFLSQPHILTLRELVWKPYFSPSTLSYDEIEAANWISQNAPKDVIVISELNTQVILGALANREESSFFYGVSSIDLRTVFMTTNASEAYQLLMQYRQQRIEYDKIRENRGSHFLTGNRPVIIIINGRVSRMLNNPDAKSGPNVPVGFTSFDGFNKFYDGIYFTPLHEINNQIYLFAVKIDGTTYAD